MTPLSRAIRSNHFPFLCRGVRIHVPWILIGLAGVICSRCCCYCCCVASVVSNSVQHQRRQPTRLPHPWDSPGKNTGVGCHCLLQCMKVKSESEVVQSCPTLTTLGTAAHQAPPSMGFSRQSTGVGKRTLVSSAHTKQQTNMKCPKGKEKSPHVFVSPLCSLDKMSDI